MGSLRLFAQRYRDLFEMLSDGVVVWKLTGEVVTGNDAMAALTGYAVDELRGMNVATFVSLEDMKQVTERQRQQISGEADSQRYEVGLLRKDGTQITIELVTRLLRDKSGPTGVLASAKNITEQKLAHGALLEERDRAQSYLDVAGVAIQVIDAEQRAALMNKKCCEVFGCRAEDIVGLNWFNTFIPERNRAIAKATFNKLMARQIAPGKCHESPVVTGSGEERIMAWYNTRVLTDEAGNPIGVLGSGEDVTERRQMEKALRDSERRYRALFEDSRDAICIVSRDGRLIEANHAASELVGCKREDFVGADVHLISDTDARARFQREIEHKGYVRDYEMRLHRNGGTPVDCLLTFSLRRADNGEIVGYEGIIRDVTELKRLQQNMLLYIQQITNAQEEERKRIARELHDETIQELAVLSLDIEGIIRAKGRVSRASVKGLQQIQQKVNHMAEELSRLSHALRPSVLDQLGLIPALKVLIDNLRRTSQIDASLDVVGRERRLSPEVEVGLFRMVQEALRNVRRHSEAARAVVRAEFGGDGVSVTVTDDGKGFQLPGRLGDFAGRGKLGLVGMQERVQLFGGVFSVHSEVGKGTTVSVVLGDHALVPRIVSE
ncbi:MAG: PAS domain S-box protein [Chloroflexi bacterium]|nr:PAS domain S-box protein [Chloroflexota bacterium]